MWCKISVLHRTVLDITSIGLKRFLRMRSFSNRSRKIIDVPVAKAAPGLKRNARDAISNQEMLPIQALLNNVLADVRRLEDASSVPIVSGRESSIR